MRFEDKLSFIAFQIILRFKFQILTKTQLQSFDVNLSTTLGEPPNSAKLFFLAK